MWPYPLIKLYVINILIKNNNEKEEKWSFTTIRACLAMSLFVNHIYIISIHQRQKNHPKLKTKGFSHLIPSTWQQFIYIINCLPRFTIILSLSLSHFDEIFHPKYFQIYWVNILKYYRYFHIINFVPNFLTLNIIKI